MAKWDSGAYLLAGSLWLCLTLDAKTRISELAEYTHIAFDSSKENFQKIVSSIKNSGAIIWKNNASEGDSLYFLDPNGHKLEIHASTHQERIEACKLKPYSGMIFSD